MKIISALFFGLFFSATGYAGYVVSGVYTKVGETGNIEHFKCVGKKNDCFGSHGPSTSPTPGDEININDGGTIRKATYISTTSDPTGSSDGDIHAAEIDD